MEIEPLQTITRLGLFDGDLSPDGRAVAGVYQDDDGRRLGIWSTRGCHWLQDLTLPGTYHRPRFDPTATRLAAARDGAGVAIWSVADARLLAEIAPQGSVPLAAHAFGPAGESIALALGQEVSFWSSANGAWQDTMPFPGPIASLGTSATGDTLAIGLRAGGALVVDVPARRVLATLPGLEQAVSMLAFHPARPWLLVVTAPNYSPGNHPLELAAHGWAIVWNYRTGEEITRLVCDSQGVFLGGGAYVGTLTNNSRNLWVWHIPEARLAAHIENVAPETMIGRDGPEARPVTLAATPQGDLLAVAGLTRPISPVGALRLFAFHAERVPA